MEIPGVVAGYIRPPVFRQAFSRPATHCRHRPQDQTGCTTTSRRSTGCPRHPRTRRCGRRSHDRAPRLWGSSARVRRGHERRFGRHLRRRRAAPRGLECSSDQAPRCVRLGSHRDIGRYWLARMASSPCSSCGTCRYAVPRTPTGRQKDTGAGRGNECHIATACTDESRTRQSSLSTMAASGQLEAPSRADSS